MLLKRPGLGGLAIAALAFGLAMPAHAYDIIQTSQNNTGATANGQKLVLYGAQTIDPNSLNLGPTTPFTKMATTVAATATGINYTGGNAVAPLGTATISVRTGSTSALAKSLSWITSTGAFLGNSTVIGGSCTASPATAIPAIGSNGSIRLAQAGPVGKAFDWTFYNGADHDALVNFNGFNFLKRTVTPGNPPTETFTVLDVNSNPISTRFFGGAGFAPPNSGAQYLIPPGGGILFHFAPIIVTGDVWVRATGDLTGHDAGHPDDHNTFIHRCPFPTCDNGPRAFTSGEAHALIVQYANALSVPAARRTARDNDIIAEGDVLLPAVQAQINTLNFYLPNLNLAGALDVLGSPQKANTAETKADIELVTLLINITRNSVCPDDVVPTQGGGTPTVEQLMYQAAGLISSDPANKQQTQAAWQILAALNRAN